MGKSSKSKQTSKSKKSKKNAQDMSDTAIPNKSRLVYSSEEDQNSTGKKEETKNKNKINKLKKEE